MLAAEDEQFRRRILGTIETVKRWDRDSTLLRRVRDSIPMDDLMSSSKFDRPDDVMLDPSVRFIQRLSRYFKHKMTWINQPKCQTCQSNEHMTLKKTRGPETDEEKFGQANRVEVYTCSKCPDGNETTFPRYNNVAKLFETHSGRCGEYANLFGLYCRALGYETRYIHDVTDHVWIEVYIPRNLGPTNHDGETTTTGSQCYWMMVDACEGVIDETSMYEAGWNKKLSYIIAVSTTHVIDVTSKYTRQFLEADFQARRRAITTSEESGESIIKQLNSTLLNNISTAKEKEQMERRLSMEQQYLQQYERYQTKWIHRYGRGRISGSLVWKQQRQEDGGGNNNNNQQEKKSSSSPSHFYVEPYYYLPKDVTISTSTNITIVLRPYPYVRHEAIQVNGVSCAIGVLHTLSVVVMDETYIGCILQSKCCTSLKQLLDFIQTVPCQRIVAIVGSLPNKGNEDDDTPHIVKQLSKQLGGFDGTLAFEDKNASSSSSSGILYIGQVVGGDSSKKSADWTYCCSFQEHPHGFVLEGVGAGDDSSLATTTNLKLNLKTISGYKPTSVIGRLPEHVMPMETQKLASHSQKRIAFHQFVDNCENVWISGYCTKPGMPIYLLGSNAYPFVQSSSSGTKETDNVKHADWTTFLRLPSPLVSEDDHGLEDDDANTKKTTSSLPSFEIPVDTTFFSQRLGSELWKGSTKIPTSVALQNTRLVALYFSAHWCGPCRSFTPMLAEMYDVLKEAYPTHGLEIVFVTSDRDSQSFTQYYSTMPWLAIPFENLNPFMKQTLSTTYGVRGIPSLVVLDSISGQIVISQNETRQHVMEACRKGNDGIEDMFQMKWLSQIPFDSKQLMDMLQRSCEEDNKKSNGDGGTNNDSELQYLLRQTNDNSSSLEERQQLLVKQLMEEGVDEEEAEESARIIIMDMEQDEEDDDVENKEPSLLDGYFQRRTLTNVNELTLRGEAFPKAFVEQVVKKESSSLIITALNASLKYLENCRKEPYNPKYRQFILANKFASKTITNALGMIPLLESIGFTCSAYEDDFTIMIPIYANLDTMYQSITQLLDVLSS